MTQYATLKDALTDIAGRSFHDSASVTPLDDGYYAVDDHYTGEDEYLMWSYKDGIETPSSAVDYSRAMEPYEFFSTADHIRYNMHNAVNEIIDGKTIAFQYVVLDAWCDHDTDGICDEDHTAGWALIAYTA